MIFTTDRISYATLTISTKPMYDGYDAGQSVIPVNTSGAVPAHPHILNKAPSFHACYAQLPRSCSTLQLWTAMAALSFESTHQITHPEPQAPIHAQPSIHHLTHLIPPRQISTHLSMHMHCGVTGT
jgi:hypothetical protein